VNFDLLADWRSALNVNVNLPDIVIWRMHVKISIRITVPTQQANDGVFISSWVDSKSQVTLQSSVSPYDQKYLIWDQQYITEQIKQSGTLADPVIYREYDVKSHRRLQDMNETLFLGVEMTGSSVGLDVSYTSSVLLKLP